MFRSSAFLSGLAAVIAFVLAAALINHGLIDSSLPVGPGLTLDESFNIDQGVYLVDALEQHGPLLFTPTVAREVFGIPRYLPDHPPVGRVVLGIAHQMTSWLIPGSESTAYNVPAARLGSCFALAITVLLITEFARRRYGNATAVCDGTCPNRVAGICDQSCMGRCNDSFTELVDKAGSANNSPRHHQRCAVGTAAAD